MAKRRYYIYGICCALILSASAGATTRSGKERPAMPRNNEVYFKIDQLLYINAMDKSTDMQYDRDLRGIYKNLNDGKITAAEAETQIDAEIVQHLSAAKDAKKKDFSEDVTEKTLDVVLDNWTSDELDNAGALEA